MRRLYTAVRPGLWGSIALAAAVASVTACGSGESDLTKPTPMSCGAGTVAAGDQCVPVEAGAAGGSAGAAGAAGTAEHGGAAGEPTDAESPDGPSDAPEEGAPGPGDDPCPDEPIFLNCSDSCGPKSPECEQLTCDIPYPTPKVLADDSVAKIIVRTPSHPGTHPNCKQTCEQFGEIPRAATLILGLNQSSSYDGGSYSKGYRATVGAPWHVDVMGAPSMLDLCKSDKDWLPQCRPILGDGEMMLKFFTDDPSAGARNVVIERLPNPVKCP